MRGSLRTTCAHAQAAFTLLELIVVVAIFAVFSLMAYGGLDSVLKTRGEVERAMERTAELQKAYMRLRSDLQQVRDRPARDGYGDRQPAVRTEQTGRVEFTRGGWRNPLMQPRPTLERVSYRLDEKKFKRESFRVLDQAQDSKLTELVLIDGVDEVQWRFLDAERAWHTQWPPLSTQGESATSPPPMAAELTLTTRDWGKLVFLFRLGLEPEPAPLPGGGATTGGSTTGGATTGGTTGGTTTGDAPPTDRPPEDPS